MIYSGGPLSSLCLPLSMKFLGLATSLISLHTLMQALELGLESQLEINGKHSIYFQGGNVKDMISVGQRQLASNSLFKPSSQPAPQANTLKFLVTTGALSKDSGKGKAGTGQQMMSSAGSMMSQALISAINT